MKKKKYIFKKILTGLLVAAGAFSMVKVYKNIDNIKSVFNSNTPEPEPEPDTEEYKAWKAVTTRVAGILEDRMDIENLDIKTLKITPCEDASSDTYNSALNLICTYSDCGVNKIGKFDISLNDTPQTLEQLTTSLDRIKENCTVQSGVVGYVCTNNTEKFANEIYKYNNKVKSIFANPQTVLCGGQPIDKLTKLGIEKTEGTGVATGYLFEEGDKLCFLSLAYKIDYDENRFTNLKNYFYANINNSILDYYLKEMGNSERKHELLDYSIDYFDQDISNEFRQYSKMYGKNSPQTQNYSNQEIKECVKKSVAKILKLNQEEKETLEIKYVFVTNYYKNKANSLLVTFSYIRNNQTHTGHVPFGFEYEPETAKQLEDAFYFNANISLNNLWKSGNAKEYVESKTGYEFVLKLIKNKEFFKGVKNPNFEVLSVSVEEIDSSNSYGEINVILKDNDTGKIYWERSAITYEKSNTDIFSGDPYEYFAKNPSSYDIPAFGGDNYCLSDLVNFSDIFIKTQKNTIKIGDYTVNFG